MISNFSNRLGEIFTNNSGLKMTIIEYVNNKNVTVEFESGYTKTTNMVLLVYFLIKKQKDGKQK